MRVAVVTGGNKGIGYGICRALLKQFEGIVYLTARNESLGLAAVEQLNGEKFDKKCSELKFHQLDITDQKSIDALRDYLKSHYGGLDILVNNAGIAYKKASTAPFGEQAEVTMKTNFWGTLKVCRSLFPILKPHARVVNVSSAGSGMLSNVSDLQLRAKFSSPALTMEELGELMNQFVKAAQDGKHTEAGFSNSAYGMTKVGKTAMTRVLQRELETDPREGIVVTACCPGHVATDMSSHKGPRNIDQGAETPVFLALLPQGWSGPKGRFFYDKQEKEWVP